jgi:clan AA aspartic protease
MITGGVTASREAIVRLELRGPRSAVVTDAVIDTGFTDFLSLPLSLVTALGLAYLQTDKVFLADGSEIAVDQYEVTVIWDGQRRDVIAHCLEGSPLIGMSLLYDHLLTMEVVSGGPVSIDRIP